MSDPGGRGPRSPTGPSSASEALARRSAGSMERRGELVSAARLFELAGEPAQAASLHLEHADSLGDEGARLAALRTAASRIGGETPPGRHLHERLARVLLQAASSPKHRGNARPYRLDAARAFEQARLPAKAGRIFEELGLLEEAARCYEQGGAVEELEFVLARLEGVEQRAQARRRLAQDFDLALRTGQRRLAHALAFRAREHARAQAEALPPELDQGLRHLDSSRPSAKDFLVSHQEASSRFRRRILSAERIVLGRAPHSHLSLPYPTLSREHLHINLPVDPDGGPTARDLDTRGGSFVDGEAIIAPEPFALPSRGELALGDAPAMSMTWRSTAPFGIQLELQIPASGADPWVSVLRVRHSGEGPLWDLAGTDEPSGLVQVDGGGWLDLRLNVSGVLELNGRRLPGVDSFQPLLGDRVRLLPEGSDDSSSGLASEAHWTLEFLR